MSVWFKRFLNIVGIALGKFPDDPLSEDEKEIEDFVADNNLRKVDQLLLEDPTLKEFRDEFGTTLLIHSVQEEHYEMTRLLLSHGCGVNETDNEGQSPLHFAVIYENAEIVKLLLDHGASPDVRDSHGMTPAEHADPTVRTTVSALLQRGRKAPST